MFILDITRVLHFDDTFLVVLLGQRLDLLVQLLQSLPLFANFGVLFLHLLLWLVCNRVALTHFALCV